jgi:hypothetical protein
MEDLSEPVENLPEGNIKGTSYSLVDGKIYPPFNF